MKKTNLILIALLAFSAGLFADKVGTPTRASGDSVLPKGLPQGPLPESTAEAAAKTPDSYRIYIYSDDVFHSNKDEAERKARKSAKEKTGIFLEKLKRRLGAKTPLSYDASPDMRLRFATEIRYYPIPFNLDPNQSLSSGSTAMMQNQKFRIIPEEGEVIRPAAARYAGLKVPNADITYHCIAEQKLLFVFPLPGPENFKKETEWCGGSAIARNFPFTNSVNDFDMSVDTILVIMDEAAYNKLKADKAKKRAEEVFNDAAVLQDGKASLNISVDYSTKAGTQSGVRSAIRKSAEETGVKLDAFKAKIRSRLIEPKTLFLEPKGSPAVSISGVILKKPVIFRGEPKMLEAPPSKPLGEYVVLSSPLPEGISGTIIQASNVQPPSVQYTIAFSQTVTVSVDQKDLENLRKALDWLMPGYLKMPAVLRPEPLIPGTGPVRAAENNRAGYVMIPVTLERAPDPLPAPASGSTEEKIAEPNTETTAEASPEKPADRRSRFDSIEILPAIPATVYGARVSSYEQGTGNRSPNTNAMPAKVFCIKTKTIEYTNDGMIFQ